MGGAMKEKAYKIITACGMLAACAALHSCVPDDMAAAIDPAALYVTFRVAAPSADGMAAMGMVPGGDGGTWGDGYALDPAAPSEETVRDLHAAFFDAADGSYVGRISDITFSPSSSGVYLAQGVVIPEDPEVTVEELRGKTLRLMCVANVPVLLAPDWYGLCRKGLAAGDGLGGLTFTAPSSVPASIPMWGVCTPGLSGLKAGEALELGGVPLLRATAKVVVTLADNEDLEGVTLKGATLSHANTKGYVVPGGWDKAASTKDLAFAGTTRIPADAGPTASFSAPASGGSIIFYLPECVNGTGAAEMVMTVTYEQDGEEGQGEIRFCPYDGGQPDMSKPWDIVRNHCYMFTINSVASSMIMFSVHAEDWIQHSNGSNIQTI